MPFLPSDFHNDDTLKGKCFKLVRENHVKKDEYLGKFVEIRWNLGAQSMGRPDEVSAALHFQIQDTKDTVQNTFFQLPTKKGDEGNRVINWEKVDEDLEIEKTDCINFNAPPKKWSNRFSWLIGKTGKAGKERKRRQRSTRKGRGRRSSQ